MGLFDKLFKNQNVEAQKVNSVFQGLNWYQPVFTNWSGAVYESELIRSAIDAKARHISKLKVEIKGAARPRLQTKIKHDPNEWMTWSQFLYRLSTILDVNNSAIIIPVKDVFDETVGFYPVLPTQSKLMQDKSGREYLVCTYGSGRTSVLPREECGIMTRFQYSSDFFGETNAALAPTMDLVEVQNKGIKEAVKNTNTFRFMARMNNFSKPTDLMKAQKEFNETSMKNGGGALVFPNTWSDIKQITSSPYTVDSKQMEIIKANVFDYFGVNEDVLQNKAQGEGLDAFFNGSIEPFMIQLSEVLSKMVFTEKERSSGSEFIATANRLQYMSTSEKINMVQQLADRGLIQIDQVAELFNYTKIGGDIGSLRPIRGEYYFMDSEGNIVKKEGENTDAGSDE